MTLTFFGVGAIGLPMAARLAASGASVVAVDPLPERRALAEEAGLRAEPTAQAAAAAEVVVVMVATAPQLHALALGTGAGADDAPSLLAIMPEGSTLVVMSTVGPEAVRGIAQTAALLGIGVLDVPVSGGIRQAEDGCLTLFASGAPALLDEHRALLGALGAVKDCGSEPGQGQAYAAVNQLLTAVHIAVAAEALAFAQALDLDPATVVEAVRGDDGAERWPRMLAGPEVEVRSAIGNVMKDIELIAGIAERADVDTPLINAAAKRYRAAAGAGLVASDDSQVIQAYRR